MNFFWSEKKEEKKIQLKFVINTGEREINKK